jgi:hypothetical protein
MAPTSRTPVSGMPSAAMRAYSVPKPTIFCTPLTRKISAKSRRPNSGRTVFIVAACKKNGF